MNWKNILKKYLPLTIITLAAFFFRFYHFSIQPPGLDFDEASDANGVISFLEGSGKLPSNNQGVVHYLLLALGFKVFGIGAPQIRIPAALIGSLTVILLYFFAKFIFNKQVAFFSAFFMAISPWHTSLSRIGAAATLVPFFILLIFLFLELSRRKKGLISKIYLFLAGFMLGAGVYTYPAFFPTIPLVTLYLYLFYKNIHKFPFFLGIAVGLSLFLGKLEQTLQAMTIHANDISFLNPSLNQGAPITTLTDSLMKNILVFFFYPNKMWIHINANDPVLKLPLNLFFLFSLSLVVFISQKKKLIFLFCWFLLFLLPAIFSANDIPSIMRLVGTTIPVFTLIGFWCGQALSVLSKKLNPLLINLLIFITLSLTALSNFSDYFITLPQQSEYHHIYDVSLFSARDYLVNQQIAWRKTPKDSQALGAKIGMEKNIYIILENKYSRSTLEFLLRDYTLSGNLEVITHTIYLPRSILSSGDIIIFPLPFANLKPDSQWRLIYNEFNQFGEEAVTVYEVI